MTAEKTMVDIVQLLTVLKELKYGYFCWPSKPIDQWKDFQFVIHTIFRIILYSKNEFVSSYKAYLKHYQALLQRNQKFVQKTCMPIFSIIGHCLNNKSLAFDKSKSFWGDYNDFRISFHCKIAYRQVSYDSF